MTQSDPRPAVESFMEHARRVHAENCDKALRKIAGMTPEQAAAEAPDIAQEALGIGKYWNKGFAKP